MSPRTVVVLFHTALVLHGARPAGASGYLARAWLRTTLADWLITRKDDVAWQLVAVGTGEAGLAVCQG